MILTIQESLKRDERKQVKLEKEGEKLLKAISERGITVLASNELKLKLSDLEHHESHIPQGRVELNEDNKLLWPVMILYPERTQSDFVEKFHEDMSYVSTLKIIFLSLSYTLFSC